MADETGDLDEVQDLSGAVADFDYDDQNTDFFSVGKKIKIDLRDMDYISWKREIDADIETLQLLIAMVEDITPEYDFQLRADPCYPGKGNSSHQSRQQENPDFHCVR